MIGAMASSPGIDKLNQYVAPRLSDDSSEVILCPTLEPEGVAIYVTSDEEFDAVRLLDDEYALKRLAAEGALGKKWCRNLTTNPVGPALSAWPLRPEFRLHSCPGRPYP